MITFGNAVMLYLENIFPFSVSSINEEKLAQARPQQRALFSLSAYFYKQNSKNKSS
jgi:hypothetical protein